MIVKTLEPSEFAGINLDFVGMLMSSLYVGNANLDLVTEMGL